MPVSTYRTTSLAHAVAALALASAGGAQAAFVLGPFSVTQTAEAEALRNGTSLVTVGPSLLDSVAPGVSTVSFVQQTSDAAGLSGHSVLVPNGNRAFSVLAIGVDSEGLVDTTLAYDFTFTNTSATSFTGSISFLVHGLTLSNRCSASYGCSDTDPDAVAGLDLRLTTTRPGAVITEQNLHVELGAGGLLTVIEDDFNVGSLFAPTALTNQIVALNTSPVRLKVDLGTVAPGESVVINYDTRAYTSSNDGTCQPAPVPVEREECVRFEEVPVSVSGGSGGSTTRVCVETTKVVVLVPQNPERCTVRSVSLTDPAEDQPSLGLALEASGNRLPVSPTWALALPGLFGVGWLQRRRRAHPPATRASD